MDASDGEDKGGENGRERRQTKIRGSRLVVLSVAFPACVKHISRQGVICSL